MSRLGSVLSLLALAGFDGSACAQDVADFYRGKTLAVIVGSAPGGGYDAFARVVARHIGRHVPGSPGAIVQNMPGAGQSIAAAYVYFSAPKDGTVIVATSPGALLAPLLGGPKVRYDPRRFQYIGSANEEVYACYAKAGGPVASFADTFRSEWIVGVTSGTTRDLPSVHKHILGTKAKLVSGYRNSKDVLLAIERGEVQGLCGLGWASFTMQNPDLVPQGRIKVIVQDSLKGHPELNRMGVPLGTSFAGSEEQRQALELVYSQGVFGRPFALAPEVPVARVAVLRRAFMAAMADPELAAEAARMQLDIGAISGEALQAALTKAFATPQAVVEMARRAIDADAAR